MIQNLMLTYMAHVMALLGLRIALLVELLRYSIYSR
jgi:hypothetical protein